jgi:hypothetical protein
MRLPNHSAVRLSALPVAGIVLASCILIEPFPEIAPLAVDHEREREDAADCHADLANDPYQCGACGHVCSWNNVVAPPCRAGRCVVECRGGFADCDGDPSNGCEIDLYNDSKNCVRCGRSCGGACKGLCQPLVLAELQKSPSAIVVGQEYAYVVLGPKVGIGKVPIQGGSVTALGADSGSRQVTALALSASYLYWDDADSRTIYETPLPSGASRAVSFNQTVASLAADDHGVVWSENTAHEIRTLEGSAVKTLASRPLDGVGKLAIDDEYVYFIAPISRKLFKVSRAGGDPLQLYAAPAGRTINAIALDASTVYFAAHDSAVDGNAIDAIAKDGTRYVNLSGFPATSLATDGKDLFFADPKHGWIQKHSVRGGAGGQILAQDQATPWAIALDATHVYWVNRGGTASVMKVEKEP